jgi:hypothetical protein
MKNCLLLLSAPIVLAGIVLSQAAQVPGRASASPKKTAVLTPEQKEAQAHYKVATLAMQDGNLDIAVKELEQASRLDPKNAVIWYNLAVVQSQKHMSSSALEAINQALTLGLPAKLKKAADEMQVKLKYEAEKSKQNPRLLLGQELSQWSCPGYQHVVEDQRDLFLVTVAPFLGPKENISYAKYAPIGDGALKRYYQDWDPGDSYKACFSNLLSQRPDLAEKKRTNYEGDGGHLYNNFETYAAATCQRKVSSPYQEHANEIGGDLRSLGYDAFITIRSEYRCAWKPTREMVEAQLGTPTVPQGYPLERLSPGTFYDFDQWADFRIELITSEGKAFSTQATVYLGHNYDQLEPLGRDPNLMFSRVGRELRAPLVQLVHDAGFSSP